MLAKKCLSDYFEILRSSGREPEPDLLPILVEIQKQLGIEGEKE